MGAAIDSVRSVRAADLDGDGDHDVLSTTSWGNKLAWYENVDGRGTFSEEVIISNSAVGVHSVDASDLDGDGDLDVLTASVDFPESGNDNRIAWYENTGGGRAIQIRS